MHPRLQYHDQTFKRENGLLKKLHAVRLQWSKDPATGQMKMSEIAGSEFEMDCDLLLLALGFTGRSKKG